MKLEKRDKKSDFVMVRSQEGGKFKKENKVLKSAIIRPKWSTNIIHFLCVFPKEIKENTSLIFPSFLVEKIIICFIFVVLELFIYLTNKRRFHQKQDKNSFANSP